VTTLLRTIDSRIARNARTVNAIVLVVAVLGAIVMAIAGARLPTDVLKEFLPN
jgi:hypothetical protein